MGYTKPMNTQTITLEISETLYRFATQVALATTRPLAEIIQESLTRTLPPLDDIPTEEQLEFARLSTLDDGTLWQIADGGLTAEEQDEMHHLLDMQSAKEASAEELEQLHALMELYGQITVRKSHAWLLLARRGYKVPVQVNR